MIKAKKGIFHIKNRETGEFEPVVAVKGDKGDGADVVIKDTFFTSETGDSEELAMTQKGVTILYDRILNGNDTVEHALLADRALNVDNADSATKAEQDAKGNIIDETYATLTNVNGSILSTNILDKAVELIGDGKICKIEHRYISISDAQWVEGDFDIPEGAARYGYVTFFIRWTHVTVWLWGGYGSSVYYNSYGNGKWVGWRKVIDSNNINGQSVRNAENANRATYDANGHILYGRTTLWSGSKKLETNQDVEIITTEDATLKYLVIQTTDGRSQPIRFDTTTYVSVTHTVDGISIYMDNRNPKRIVLTNKGDKSVTVDRIYVDA